MYNIRKPGEGEDQSKWKGLTLKKRDDTDEEHEQEETDDEVCSLLLCFIGKIEASKFLAKFCLLFFLME